MNYKTWLNSLVTSAQKSLLPKTAAKEDLTLPTLSALLDQGYSMVEWESANSTHAVCMELNGQKWALPDFLTGLQHSAPMAEKSHPNCKCFIVISGDGLPTIRMDYDGNWEHI